MTAPRPSDDPSTPKSTSSAPHFLAIGAVAWYVILWSIGLIGWRNAKKRFTIRPRSPLTAALPDTVPGVSILRPLKGLDPNLFENLESTFIQEYPKFEILLSVADEKDQALNVVRELMTKYPAVNARVVIGEKVVGVNPKVNNLMRPYHEAAYDILWVLDSNVMVAPGTLARSVDALNNNKSSRRIGLVHHVPFAFTSERSTGSRLEEAFLNTNHAKMYLAINRVAIDSCVVGKSNMYRRSDIERLTGTLKPLREDSPPDPSQPRGLAAFGRFLAEDNMIGSALWHELGLRHDLSCDVAPNALGSMPFSTYVWRRVRWIRVRKHMVLAATLLEPFTESVVSGLIAAWALRTLFGLHPLLFFLLHTAAFLTIDLDVYACLAGHPVYPSERWSFIGAWVCRELLAFPIWALAMLGNEVEWRGIQYRVMRNGEVKKVERAGKRTAFGRWVATQIRRRTGGYEQVPTEMP